MTIGKRISEERKRLRLNQADFAKLAGVSFSSQRRYEDGRSAPDTAYLEALQRIGVDVGFVVGYPKPTADELLSDARSSIKVDETGKAEDPFESGPGWLLLCALGIPHSTWNVIANKLIQLDEAGIPLIDGTDPAWGEEIAKASPLIAKLASMLDSALLTAVLEGVDGVLSVRGETMPPAKKAQAVAMLYRAFKASGKVDPAMIEEAVKLASG